MARSELTIARTFSAWLSAGSVGVGCCAGFVAAGLFFDGRGLAADAVDEGFRAVDLLGEGDGDAEAVGDGEVAGAEGVADCDSVADADCTRSLSSSGDSRA
ncbi:hypothetical protein, partial [Streptomyces lunaelactis]|uniref:hypothetical protein n=1 Tax=Streptomyces lunaelactis TaxID=1535768 RepID=UPI0020C7D14B